jgi:hypothetical protein
MASFYPTIVSQCMVSTVNFYEDYFGFVPAIEKEGYVLLRQEQNPAACIAVFDKTHRCVNNVVEPVRGVIVNIVVNDVKEKFDALYMEGLDFYKEFGTDINGNDHFVVYDPNGILINVHAPFGLVDASLAA